MKFINDSINVTSTAEDMTSGEEILTIKKDYSRSIGDNIWYDLVEGLLRKKGNDPEIDCQCRPDRFIQMMDIDGNVLVQGNYNGHKFYVDIEGVYSTIFVNDNDDIQKGYDNLADLCLTLEENLSDELSKYKNYIFLPVDDTTLIYDDDVYYAVGGGCIDTHTLQASNFKNESLTGEIQSITIIIKYKTDPHFSNNNTLKLIYYEIIDTDLKFNSTENEIEVRIDVSSQFDLETVLIEDISLTYENPGGILPTPKIYFEYIWIEVRSYSNI
jgi:hypothetical protein